MPARDYDEVRTAWEVWNIAQLLYGDDTEESLLACEDDAEFDPGQIPAYCDGDYPAWLQQHMDAVLPIEILQQYGKIVSSVFNGDFIHIDWKCRDEIVASLERLGYEVVEREDLCFW